MDKPKILLIDDTPDYCMLFQQALKSKNVEVISFDNATKAIEFLINSNELPSLTFVDLRMPEMSGDEFVKRVRADSKLNKLKIFISSATSNLQSIARSMGADGCLRKPFDLSDLDRIVDRECLMSQS